MASTHFEHLEDRCNILIQRFLDPAIEAELVALDAGLPVPTPNFDDFAAFRLLTHAELEGYFESLASDAVATLDGKFKQGHTYSADIAALIYLYLWKDRRPYSWSAEPNDDLANIRELAQEALGFARKFIKDNNGIKEKSIHVLSALMGFFPDDLDSILVSELNQYGKNRGDVAHSSWHFNTRTFESAEIEKMRLIKILSLTKAYYET